MSVRAFSAAPGGPNVLRHTSQEHVSLPSAIPFLTHSREAQANSAEANPEHRQHTQRTDGDEFSSPGQSDRAPRQSKARAASNSVSISDAVSRDTGQTAAQCAKIRQRRPISGRAPRVLNSRCARHGHFPAVLSTVHAQSALAAVWGHCPCSMRSGCGLGHCLPQT